MVPFLRGPRTPPLTVDLRKVKTVLFDKFCDTWKRDVLNKPKLRLYKDIFTKFETKDYVTMNLSRRERSILGQIVSGILPLNLEVGRQVQKSTYRKKAV